MEYESKNQSQNHNYNFIFNNFGDYSKIEFIYRTQFDLN